MVKPREVLLFSVFYYIFVKMFNMEKTLVYHLYVKEDFQDNIAYKIHSYCLKKYISVFNKVKFTLSVDDLTNHDLIQQGFELINNIVANCEKQINVIKNGELG